MSPPRQILVRLLDSLLLLYLDHTFVGTFSLTSPSCMYFTGNYFEREDTASANCSGANYNITHRSSSPEEGHLLTESARDVTFYSSHNIYTTPLRMEPLPQRATHEAKNRCWSHVLREWSGAPAITSLLANAAQD